MIDPDIRESWAKLAEENQRKCGLSGHTHAPSTGRCVCGHSDPTKIRPHVTLRTVDYRCVFNPIDDTLVIEKRSTDTLGGERWDLVETRSNVTRRGYSEPHIFELLTKGRAP